LVVRKLKRMERGRKREKTHKNSGISSLTSDRLRSPAEPDADSQAP